MREQLMRDRRSGRSGGLFRRAASQTNKSLAAVLAPDDDSPDAVCVVMALEGVDAAVEGADTVRASGRWAAGWPAGGLTEW